jgi:hypothetical protein
MRFSRPSSTGQQRQTTQQSQQALPGLSVTPRFSSVGRGGRHYNCQCVFKNHRVETQLTARPLNRTRSPNILSINRSCVRSSRSLGSMDSSCPPRTPRASPMPFTVSRPMLYRKRGPLNRNPLVNPSPQRHPAMMGIPPKATITSIRVRRWSLCCGAHSVSPGRRGLRRLNIQRVPTRARIQATRAKMQSIVCLQRCLSRVCHSDGRYRPAK